MAIIQINYVSAALHRSVPVTAIIPTDKHISEKRRQYKTLYLLHGVYGDCTDWIAGTRIARWAQEKDLAVIMPSGENKFYVDIESSGDSFGEFIGNELPEFCNRTFPLSEKREDTFIGGLSMGGYGAIRNGLKYSKRFGYITALSAAFIFDDVKNAPKSGSWSFENCRQFYELMFGRLDDFSGSDCDYYALAEALSKSGEPMPKVYLCCGEQDRFMQPNRQYYEYLKKLGYSCTFEHGQGGHDWDFWDRYIKRIIDLLPLGEAISGINSGHIE